MSKLDREFLERVGGTIAKLKMLATLKKRPDLVAEADDWESRRKALMERIDADRRVIDFPQRVRE